VREDWESTFIFFMEKPGAGSVLGSVI